MQPVRFTASGLLIERHLPREGPPYYLVYRNGRSSFAMTQQAAAALAAWPRSTPTGAAMREWLAAHPLSGAAAAPAPALPAPSGEAGAAPLPLVPPADEPEPAGPETAMPEPNDNTRTII